LLPSELREIAIGMILSDACMYKKRKSKDALIKFEQGYQQEEFHFYITYFIYLNSIVL